MAAPERLPTRRTSPSQGNPLQSSSVPSTPHQVARDLRFPSRSPSPGRGLPGRRSPRSATKESAHVPASQPSIPAICKFESGAEFRKRRIPYKDGGNEPLPPPETEPKTRLEPHEEDKLSGDMRELYDRILPSPESERRRARLVEKLHKILNDEWPGNDIQVHVFGSSGNLLSSNDSDVDICITTSLKSLESMHSLAAILHQQGMERVICRAAAKVPIVKIWDPELELACDMNVNNTLALENTRMIKTYVELDDRVRPLAKIIKYWTKQRILNDAAFGGTISSYTWICMIINFLQIRDPPILPSLQKLDSSFRSVVDKKPSQFADDLVKLKAQPVENSESLGSLLFRFFRYYAHELDYSKSVVSVKEGRVLTREEKGWAVTNYQDKEARVRLCVEEPFNTNRNLGNSADDYAFSGIHQEIRRAFDLISEGKLEECCQEYVFPPEEKPLFQRPAPRPKPILTRSASQSGRSHANSVGSKSGHKESRNNRTSSNHRGNNRRASSGATFYNSRNAFMSPSGGMIGGDYFGAATPIPNDQLHEQLYKQYQLLQAQQEMLRNQLLQQQQNQAQLQAAQAHAQVHGLRSSDISASSPRQRHFTQTGMSFRALDTPPASAPLLPGYLYHYPARHAAPPMARMQEGPATLPSSPSVSSSMSSLRRTSQRPNVAEGTAPASVRSQSQPGRSFPSPVTLQSLAHPGYDVSGAIGPNYMMHQPFPVYAQPNGYDLNTPLSAGGYPMHFDTAMPKEYVGYVLGQSPQLMPQHSVSSPAQVPILREVQPKQNRSSPDRINPVLPNGIRKASRSPSPLQDRRSSSTSTNTRSAPLPQVPFADAVKQQPSKPQKQDDGRVTINGTTPHSTAGPKAADAIPSAGSNALNDSIEGAKADSKAAATSPISPAVNGLLGSPAGAKPASPKAAQTLLTKPESPKSKIERFSSNVESAGPSVSSEKSTNPWHSGPNASIRAPPPPPLNLTLQNATAVESARSPVDGRVSQLISPTVAPPLLSPVAEMQTPSPTSSRGHGSPHNEAKAASQMNRNVAIANGKLNERVNAIISNGASATAFGHRLMPDNPQPTAPSPLAQQNVQTSANGNGAGEWQQATTKKHKKGKANPSVTGKDAGSSPVAIVHHPLAIETERKGG